MFILFHMKYASWMNHASWISNYKEAQKFPEERALEMCKLHRPNLIPVRVEDMERIA